MLLFKSNVSQLIFARTVRSGNTNNFRKFHKCLV
jgi:hypothetical protein